MVASKQPKVLLFDIGGVCVVSPFQAILDYELSQGIPPGWVNNCISKTKPNGFWHRMERGEMPMNAEWFKGFNSDLHQPHLWKDFYNRAAATDPSLPKQVPRLPQIDGEWLFWEMMRASREPDPWMYPALVALKASGQYLLGALSNTMIFPPDHPYSATGLSPNNKVKQIFDVFISSAHVGMRKPHQEIYQYAIKAVDQYARESASSPIGQKFGWSEGIKPSEILFLDDIGENLKAGKAAGFGTVKVHLGRAYEAVGELEEITGLKLAGDHPRIPVEPKFSKSKL